MPSLITSHVAFLIIGVIMCVLVSHIVVKYVNVAAELKLVRENVDQLIN